VVQSRIAGTEPSDFCAKCFKDSPKLHYIDTAELYLCGGCGYEIRAWRNFLRANGISLRGVLLPVEEREELKVPEEEEGKDRVEGEGNPPNNSNGRRRPTK